MFIDLSRHRLLSDHDREPDCCTEGIALFLPWVPACDEPPSHDPWALLQRRN